MKQTIYRLSVVASSLALLLCTVQCSKETKGTDNDNDGQALFTLTATKGEDTKADLSDATTQINVTWNVGDKIYVVGETDGLRGSLTLSSGAGTSSASFSGCIKYLTAKQNVRFYYAGKGKTITGDTFNLDISTQYGTLDDIESMHVMCGTLSNVSPSTVNFGTVTMNNLIAIGKFDIVNCTGFDYEEDATLSGAVISSATLDLKTGAWGSYVWDEDITLKANLTENYFIALIPSATKQTLTFSQENKKTPDSLAEKEITAGSVYMSKGIVDGKLDNAIEIGIYKYVDGGNYWGYGRIIGDGDKVRVWAPVNCGFDNSNHEGLHYQWGRLYGQSTSLGTLTPLVDMSFENGSQVSYQNSFGYVTGTYNWYVIQNAFSTTAWNAGTEESPVKSAKDPCPDGWRVPTYTELKALVGTSTTATVVAKDGQNGVYFHGNYSSESAHVFLTLSGHREFNTSKVEFVNTWGTYYSSLSFKDTSVSDDKKNNRVHYISFSESDGVLTEPTYTFPSYGRSIRCVRFPDTDIENVGIGGISGPSGDEGSWL